MNTSPDSLSGVQQDILRTAQIKADELKGYIADVMRDEVHPFSVRDIKLFNSHIDAALQYLRDSFRPLPEAFRREPSSDKPVTGAKETEDGQGS